MSQRRWLVCTTLESNCSTATSGLFRTLLGFNTILPSAEVRYTKTTSTIIYTNNYIFLISYHSR
jgi:hypothetical protein